MVYIAGPLFTPGERLYLERLAREIDALGFSTYLPHRDAGLASGDRRNTRHLFAADIAALDRARVIVAVLNGPDVDSGTAFEIGYAVAKGVPVLGLYEDSRISDPETGFNVMIFHSCRIFPTTEALLSEMKMLAAGG